MRLPRILTVGLILISNAPIAAADETTHRRAFRDAGSHVAAGSVVLERGRRVLQGLALVGQGWGMSYRDEQTDVSQGILAVGVRGWAATGLWLQAGAGAARDAMSDDTTVLPAAMLGVGVELAGVELSCHAGSGVDDGALRVFHVSVGITAVY